MEKETIKIKLKQLNITDDTINSIHEFIVSLQIKDEEIEKLLALIEKVGLQHYIREFMKKNINL